MRQAKPQVVDENRQGSKPKRVKGQAVSENYVMFIGSMVQFQHAVGFYSKQLKMNFPSRGAVLAGACSRHVRQGFHQAQDGDSGHY